VDQTGIYVLAAAFAGVLAAIGPARRAAKVDVLHAVSAT
jgi:ABC-type antimicrobial peptide transport system permease subunit